MPDDETIALRITVIGGLRYPDEFTVIWRDLPMGRIMKSSGVRWWWWGFNFDGQQSPTTTARTALTSTTARPSS